jgi:hypothetical protein
MKHCYIIVFKITSGINNQQIIDAIKSYVTYANIADNVWAIVTESTAVNIRDFLRAYIKDTDTIFVIKSGYEAAWASVICGSEWLKANL